MNIQERLTAFAMLGATWVMWLLVGLSVVSIAIILERIYFYASTRDDIEKLRADLLDLLRQGRIADAFKRMQQSRSFEAAIAQSALQAADGGPAAATERMQSVLGEPAVANEQATCPSSLLLNLSMKRMKMVDP